MDEKGIRARRLDSDAEGYASRSRLQSDHLAQENRFESESRPFYSEQRIVHPQS